MKTTQDALSLFVSMRPFHPALLVWLTAVYGCSEHPSSLVYFRIGNVSSVPFSSRLLCWDTGGFGVIEPIPENRLTSLPVLLDPTFLERGIECLP